jgi:AcrR family transcriptional regulator
MSSSDERARAREQQILDAALLVFAQRGFAATRMDDIVLASGLSKGALYWYFESKDALILGLLKRILAAGQLLYAKALIKSSGSLLERFSLLIERFTGAIAQFPELASLLLEFYALAARQQSARLLVQDFFRQYLAALEALLRQGVERHEVRALDPAEAAEQALALVEGLLLLHAFGSLPTPLPQSFQNMLRFFWEGVCTSRGVEREEEP